MAFKFKYECEFCGKEKVMTEEQARTAICECETSIDLNNTWCEATEENYNALLYIGLKEQKGGFIYPKNGKLRIVKNTIIEYDFDSNIEITQKLKKVHLVNGKFEFIKSELDILKEKYETGNYIIIRLNDNGYERKWIIQTDFYKGLNGIKFKLIHKKHKDILDAYLKDNTIDIEVVYSLDNSSNSVRVLDFIESYDERLDYKLVDKIKYPIFKVNEDGEVFRFNDKDSTGECLLWKDSRLEATKRLYDKYFDFTPIPCSKERGLYHKQPVWFRYYDCEKTMDIYEIGYYNVSSDNIIYSITGATCHYDEIKPITSYQLKSMPFIFEMYKQIKD